MRIQARRSWRRGCSCWEICRKCDDRQSDAHIYDATLSVGVKSFQERHGLTPDGKLGKDTVAQLNVPLATRVVQLDDALERWRWLPPQFPQPPVVANIPEFVVRALLMLTTRSHSARMWWWARRCGRRLPSSPRI